MCVTGANKFKGGLLIIPIKLFICPSNILFCVAEEFSVVQKEVSDLLQGRILVGHALRNDLKVSTYVRMHGNYYSSEEWFNAKKFKTFVV